jgi:hypothetical protein
MAQIRATTKVMPRALRSQRGSTRSTISGGALPRLGSKRGCWRMGLGDLGMVRLLLLQHLMREM